MSSFKSLKDRIEFYQELTNPHLMPRLPIIVSVNGRSFSKITSFLDKPHCPKLGECMMSTMLRLCNDVEGALFAYHHNDEITLVTRNDQNPDTTPWYDNNLQKICSVTASIATMHFNDCAGSIQLNLTGDPVFTSQVYAVPNISEAINAFIYRQQHNFQTSIQFACHYELLKKHDKNTIKEMLSSLTSDEKIDLLKQECGVDFNQMIPAFRRGVACYKVPRLVEGAVKNKWMINPDLPIFTKDQSFLSNIFKMGHDIFRNSSSG